MRDCVQLDHFFDAPYTIYRTTKLYHMLALYFCILRSDCVELNRPFCHAFLYAEETRGFGGWSVQMWKKEWVDEERIQESVQSDGSVDTGTV